MKSSNDNSKGMKPMILSLTNGSFHLINDSMPKIVENLQSFKGEPLSTITGIALCHCGSLKNKQFCDGEHKTINFKEE
jgi:CDGSH-type Zn-finger protein